MNEKIDLTKILKDCPTGWKFYSSVFGEVVLEGLYYDQKRTPICVRDCSGRYEVYTKEGIYYRGAGECTLFPSKDQRDWSKFSAPWYKKDKFDPKTLKTFDNVLVQDDHHGKWIATLFSHICNGLICSIFSHIQQKDTYPYVCVDSIWKYCIPYNDDTKHLVGTTDEAPEYYRYWED